MTTASPTAAAVSAAHALIQRHGIRAAAMAQAQIAQAAASGDREAVAHWSSTRRAVEELRATARQQEA